MKYIHYVVYDIGWLLSTIHAFKTMNNEMKLPSLLCSIIYQGTSRHKIAFCSQFFICFLQISVQPKLPLWPLLRQGHLFGVGRLEWDLNDNGPMRIIYTKPVRFDHFYNVTTQVLMLGIFRLTCEKCKCFETDRVINDRTMYLHVIQKIIPNMAIWI